MLDAYLFFQGGRLRIFGLPLERINTKEQFVASILMYPLKHGPKLTTFGGIIHVDSIHPMVNIVVIIASGLGQQLSEIEKVATERGIAGHLFQGGRGRGRGRDGLDRIHTRIHPDRMDQPRVSMTEVEGKGPLGLLPMAQALWAQTTQGAQLGASSGEINKDMMLNAVACCYSALQLVLPTEYELRFRIMLANIFIRHCPSKHEEASEQLQKCLNLMNAVIAIISLSSSNAWLDREAISN